MKVHHLSSRAFWDQHEPTSLTLGGCKRLRPLAPKLTTTVNTTFDLKSFIRPENRQGSSEYQKKESAQVVEAQAGGTRWNPTQEQIKILEMLYSGGMRTPNAHQIEHITVQLSKYGKIEGKNVFYWFQNHKARERQKQKRNSINSTTTLNNTLPPSSSPFTTTTTTSCLLLSPRGVMDEEYECTSYKRKCRSWAIDEDQDDNRCCTEEDRTLKLFPLHPELRKIED